MPIYYIGNIIHRILHTPFHYKKSPPPRELGNSGIRERSRIPDRSSRVPEFREFGNSGAFPPFPSSDPEFPNPRLAGIRERSGVPEFPNSGVLRERRNSGTFPNPSLEFPSSARGGIRERPRVPGFPELQHSGTPTWNSGTFPSSRVLEFQGGGGGGTSASGVSKIV